MAQFSMKIMRLPGSVLGENQQLGQLALISRTLNDPDADTEGNSVKRTLAFIAAM